MFVIDTTGTGGGSQGPWISWTSNGSAEKGLSPRSWVLREKPEGAPETVLTVIPAFSSGCVLDLDTVKIGWEKDGATGMAPERRWNPSPAHKTPRPSEEQKPKGGYVWKEAISVRCAIGGGKAATWEQASFGAVSAFMKVAEQIMQEWPTHSQNGALLPLVVQTGVDRKQLKSGTSNMPILSVKSWVPRPDCLKADAPTFAVGAPAPVAQPAPAPQTTAATAAAVPEDVAF